MSLLIAAPNSFNWTYDNWGANPSSTPGTSITPGASNTWGNWTEIGPDASLTERTYLMDVAIYASATTNNDKSMLLDIGVDAAGGTSYVSIFGDTATAGQAATKGLICGNISLAGNIARFGYALPIEIPAGAAVAVRTQTSNSTAGTMRVVCKWYGRPSNPLALESGQSAEIVGAVTNSGGVSFTPGNAADGSWTSLGTTTARRRYWQLGVQCSNGTQTALYYYFDLAVGDGSSYHQILRFAVITNSSEQMFCQHGDSQRPVYWDVPAGATMYVRGRCSAAPDSGWNAIAVGIG